MTERHWLDAERLRVYPWLFLATWVGVAVWWVLQFPGGLASGGEPWGADFIALWSAGHLALNGDAASAWQMDSLFAAQQVAMAGSSSHYGWFYPPTALLLVAPLAVLPYLFAWAVLMGVSLMAWLMTLRPLLPDTRHWPWLLAFPAVLANLQYGQTGLLTAVVAARGLTLLDAAPVRAGLWLALLSLKPQLLLMSLPLLALTRRRALLACLAGSLLLAGLSLALWGTSPWLVWPEAVHEAGRLTASGALPWSQMPTLFATLRRLGMHPDISLGLHLLVTSTSLLVTARLWRQGADPLLCRSSAVITTLLGSAYLYDYDLAWLALPLLWLTQLGLRDGWRRGERELLFVVWLLPFLGPLLNAMYPLPLTPLMLLMLLALCQRRHLHAGVLP